MNCHPARRVGDIAGKTAFQSMKYTVPAAILLPE